MAQLEGGLHQQGVERAGAQVVVTHQSDAIFEAGLEQLLQLLFVSR